VARNPPTRQAREATRLQANGFPCRVSLSQRNKAEDFEVDSRLVGVTRLERVKDSRRIHVADERDKLTKNDELDTDDDNVEAHVLSEDGEKAVLGDEDRNVLGDEEKRSKLT
jgi:hypothetical protein